MKEYPAYFDALARGNGTVVIATRNEMITMPASDALGFAIRILRACRPGVARFTVEVDPVPWPDPESAGKDEPQP